MTSRREFLSTVGAATATLATGALSAAPTKNPFPRWRGFHYHYFEYRPVPAGGTPKAAAPPMTADYLEEDYKIISDFGFDMVRIGVQYWDWVDFRDKSANGGPLAKDLFKLKESGLARIDDAIERARKHKLHIILDMHRAPGYNFRETALGTDNEPFNLWTDKVAQDAYVFYWDTFAKRYRGLGQDEISFDLVNEPLRDKAGTLTHASYTKVMTIAVNKIRETSPKRSIMAEGLNKMASSDEVVPELIPLGVSQSIHCYAPVEVTHYRTWADINNTLPDPGWPTKLRDGGTIGGGPVRDSNGMFGRKQLEALYKPWGDLTKQGIGVHCGEFGVSSKTPNAIAMAFLTDVLDILQSYEIGWTYLSMHGSFTGLLDSDRDDVPYEDYHGHKLNRQVLSLLQRY